MHATHTVHAVHDLRIAGGRFGGRFSNERFRWSDSLLDDHENVLRGARTTDGATVKARRLEVTVIGSSYGFLIF